MQSGSSFDERLLHWIDEHRLKSLTWFTTRLMDAGQSLWVLGAVAILGLVIVVRMRAWRIAAALVAANIVGGFLTDFLKDHFQRARPTFPDAIVQVGGYAMPSSHAAAMMAPLVALLVVVRWKSRRTLVLTAGALGTAALVVGASMVYLGAHWATDVLAGWALGIVVGAAVGAVFRPRAQSA